MEQKIIQKIQRKTLRLITECSCEECKSMCTKQVCLGTPQDILKLIKAGYKDKLKPTLWMTAQFLGKLSTPVPMVQAIQDENGCVFFKNGLCELHGKNMKPLEGRLAHHSIGPDSFFFDVSVSWNVAKEWLDISNLSVVLDVFAEMDIINESLKDIYISSVKSVTD